MKAIACIDKETRAIGNKGKLIFDCKEDLKRFAKHTKGNIVVMGSKTYESLNNALPNRINIVITNHPERYSDKRDAIFMNLGNFIVVLKNMHDTSKFFLIGGGKIYDILLPYCDTIYLTEAYRPSEMPIEYDAVFPDIFTAKDEWKMAYRVGKFMNGNYKYLDKEKIEEIIIPFKFSVYKKVIKENHKEEREG